MYRIDFIELGHGLRPKDMFTDRGDTGLDFMCQFGVFLIRDHIRTILVDSGINAEEYGRNSAKPFSQTQSLEEGLEVFYLKLLDIDAVIQTHLHFDHSALLPKFKGKPVYIQADEITYARNPCSEQKGMYNPACFDSFPFRVVQGETAIAPGIRVIPVPGHTPGCQAVLVDTGDGVSAIVGFCSIAGNFIDSEQNIKPRIPSIHYDAAQADRSMIKLIGEADIIYPMHEAAALRVKRQAGVNSHE